MQMCLHVSDECEKREPQFCEIASLASPEPRPARVDNSINSKKFRRRKKKAIIERSHSFSVIVPFIEKKKDRSLINF